MARSSIKNNRSAPDNTASVLFRKWGFMISCIDQYAADDINRIFKLAKRSFSDHICLKAMTESRLGAYDEKIYECYNRLMDCYQVIVEVYQHNVLVFSDVPIKNIYDGLFDIIASRAKAFEEANPQRAAGPPGGKPGNPIALEKSGILADSLRLFGRRFDQIQYQFQSERQRALLFHAREKLTATMTAETAAAMTDDLRNAIVEGCGGALFDLYTETVKTTVLQLNDLEKRKTVAYYFDILNREHDILRNIVKVQAGALEDCIEQGTEDAWTVTVIQLILKSLREIYQHYGKETDEILAVHKAGAPTHKDSASDQAYSRETVISGAFSGPRGEPDTAGAAFADVAERFAALEKAFSGSFHKAVNRQFETALRSNSSVKEQHAIQKIFSRTETMADHMMAAFEYIYRYYTENQETLLSGGKERDNSEIIAGIAETIEIKIESIRENKAAFKPTAERFAAETEQPRPDIAPEAIAATAAQCYADTIRSLMTLGRDDRRGIALIRRSLNAVEESEAVLSYQEKRRKAHRQQIEDAHKQSLRFIKEYLLFEMMTFEEINLYSVSRLREDTNPAVAAFVAVIDRQTAVLAAILKHNGILPIYPSPHDPFNGKEHEVLMAEKNEAYKKGEIIKVMNGGYKYGDTVILRANVIAAR